MKKFISFPMFFILFTLSFINVLSQSEQENKPDTNNVEKAIELNALQSYSFPNSATTELTEEMKNYLGKIADFLKAHPNTTVALIGHSDDQGTFKQNFDRANARAEQAMQFLLKNGIPSHRILSSAKGSIEPIASNKTEAGRKMNRRLEIKVVPGPPKKK